MNQILSENTTIHKMQYVLERNQVKVQKMLEKLNSYRCEPTSYDCFNKLEELKEIINKLKDENLSIFKSIDIISMSSDSQIVKQINLLVDSFQKLDIKIEGYLLESNKSH